MADCFVSIFARQQICICGFAAMIWLYSIPIFILIARKLHMLARFSGVSSFLHHQCLHRAPLDLQNIHQALVCGETLGTGELARSLKAIALIHLFIVSGAHLLMLSWLLRRILPRLSERPFVLALLLFPFLLMTGLHAPVVRSWMSIVVWDFCRAFKLSWRSSQGVMAAGVCVCILNPQWMSSLSLILSWGGALALGTSRELTGGWHDRPIVRKSLQQCVIYLMLIPLLLPMTLPHPVAILCNLVLAPIAACCLFPLSIACFVFPQFAGTFHWAWVAFEQIINWISAHLLTPTAQIEISAGWLWAYILSIHFTFEAYFFWRSYRGLQ